MSELELAEALEHVIVGGVALTTVAISKARPGFELTFPQWRVMVVLAGTTDGARISDVARQVGVTLPATSRQLRRLERRGLVTVTPDPRDRRAVVARLTAEGAAARDAIVAYRRGRLAEVVKPFGSSPALGAALDRIGEALAQTS